MHAFRFTLFFILEGIVISVHDLSVTKLRLRRKGNVPDEVVKLVNTTENLTFIQIGACEGDFNFERSQKDKSPDPVQAVMHQPNIHAILVEANPVAFGTLQQNIQKTFGDLSRIHPIQTAITANHSGFVQFYITSEQFARDYPKKPYWAKYEISSLDRNYILGLHTQIGLAEAIWKRYIEEVNVSSQTPTDLLKMNNISSQAVDLLAVDAESFDGGIVTAFMDIQGFKPKVIIFETVHMIPSDISALVARLRGMGYNHYISGGNQDLIASLV